MTRCARLKFDGSFPRQIGFAEEIVPRIDKRFQMETRRPSAAEVRGRLSALRCVISHAFAAPPREVLYDSLAGGTSGDRERRAEELDRNAVRFWEAVFASPIAPHLSPLERRFAATTTGTMPVQQFIDALWRAESALALEWALGMASELPEPESQAEPNLIAIEDIASESKSLAAAALRPASELDRARDVAELWNWRSRTETLVRDGVPFPRGTEPAGQGFGSYAEITRAAAVTAHERGDLREVIDGDFAVKGKPYSRLSAQEFSEVRSISHERHYALNWICGLSPGNDWDATPTET